MPKLPTSQTSTDNQLLEKNTWSRGTIAPKLPVTPKIPGRKFHILHFKLVAVLCVAVIVLVLIYVGAVKFLPQYLQKSPTQKTEEKASGFKIPIEVANIQFPSEEKKNELLAEIKLVHDELDYQKRYEHIERSFVLLNNVYIFAHSYDTRLELGKFRDWIRVEYSQQYEVNKNLYDFQCLDALCDNEKVYPLEIQQITDKLDQIDVLDASVKKSIDLAFETAASIESPQGQADVYINVLSSLFNEYGRTKDERVAEAYRTLRVYIESHYQNAIIPEAIAL